MNLVRRRVLLLTAGAGVAGAMACAGVMRGSNDALATAVPDSFLVHFETSKGGFDVMAYQRWAPVGVDRFYTLLRLHYYDDTYFFRTVPGFVAQFGISGNPDVARAWRVRRIADDSVRHSNLRGTISYARGGPQTRTTQLYINLADNTRLDTLNGFGFPAFAQVVSGMSVVDSLYSAYSRTDSSVTPPRREANTPRQDSISMLGNEFLRRKYPKLDYIKTARIVREWATPRDSTRR